MPIEFHPEAEADAASALEWYGERSDVAAAAFVRELSRTLSTIEAAPTRYTAGPGGFRKAILGRFPFTVVYRVSNDSVLILAVAHQRRRPGFWRRR